MGKSNISFDASFEVAQVTATTPDEFWKQINELAKEGKEVTNICAFVVTTKLSQFLEGIMRVQNLKRCFV